MSIEEKRAKKEIGSSLEAEIKIDLRRDLEKIVQNIDFAELCITSGATVNFTENQDIIVSTIRAEGSKCPVCWKISKGQCPRHS